VILLAAAAAPPLAAAASPGATAAPIPPGSLPAVATYTVQAGDTLSAIAGRLGVPSGQIDDWVATVVALNRLSSPDEIVPGEVLSLPGPATSASTVSSSGDTYVVQDGDTLGSIAVKQGISVDGLAGWVASVVSLNGMAGPDQLATAQILRMPVATSTPNTPPAGASVPRTQKSYVVRDGETLLTIAAGAGVAPGDQPGWVSTVVSLNGLANPDDLASGQSLLLPAGAAAPDTAPTAPLLPVASSSTPPAPPGSPIPSPAPVSATPVPGGLFITLTATPYSDSLAGHGLGCQNAGAYDPNDLSVLAFGLPLGTQFPCGSRFEVCGPGGCITGTRKDTCPGCGANALDVSRAAFRLLCGTVNACSVRLRPTP
jgi:LysM repeat protein